MSLPLLAGRNAVLFVVLLAIVAAAFLMALAMGSADIGLADALRALSGTAPDQVRSLVYELRLPRATVSRRLQRLEASWASSRARSTRWRTESRPTGISWLKRERVYSLPISVMPPS